MKSWLKGAGLTLAAFMLLAAPAVAAQQDIHSTGPLTDVWIGDDLSCQVSHAGDTAYEFYDSSSTQGDCGTALSVGSTLYTPNSSEFVAYANGTPYTLVSQSAVTGAGTATSPYQVVTVETAGAIQVTETDSYVVGDDNYRTDVTVKNTGRTAVSGLVYHGADCYLQNSDSGYGYVANGDAPACTANPNNAPAGLVEEFAPITAGSHYEENLYTHVFTDIGNQTDLPNTCDCTDDIDNGAAINWDFTNLAAGASQTFSMLSNFSPTGELVGAPAATTGAAAGVTTSAATVNGTVNPDGSTVTDCHFDYGPTAGYGQTAPCGQAIGSGNTTVPVSAALSNLSPGTTYHYRVDATNASGNTVGADATFATNPHPPTQPTLSSPTTPTVLGSSSAGFTGSVNPEGLVTSAHFEYGLDPKYTGGGPIVYSQTTASQTVGSDFSQHAFSDQVSGLVPNALYHVRLVATNSAGTTTGPDETFTTQSAPPPPPPTIGQTANVQPISGTVLIKPPPGKSVHALFPFAVVNKGVGFIPLTQARQVPVGSQIDARRGTLSLVDANGHARHTQTARLTGGLFTLGQTKNGVSKGLTTFTLNAGGFPGAPTYASCPKVGKSLHADTTTPGPIASATKLSAKILQTLRASDNHGKFRTKGRYSAGTVRGTDFTTTERCDGTLTHVRKGTVDVLNFRLRRTIAVHAGHSYLASAVATKTKHRKKPKG